MELAEKRMKQRAAILSERLVLIIFVCPLSQLDSTAANSKARAEGLKTAATNSTSSTYEANPFCTRGQAQLQTAFDRCW
jgi:hypothetical protein